MPKNYFSFGPEELRNSLKSNLLEIYAQREEKLSPPFMRHIENAILLQTVDTCWKEHLTIMDHLKEGIGLRGYGQRDPLVEYKLEATDLFNGMIRKIREETVSLLFKLDFNPEKEIEVEKTQDLHYSSTEEEIEELNEQKRPRQQPMISDKIGRNDPCPCGSGKKFKRCCGATL